MWFSEWDECLQDGLWFIYWFPLGTIVEVTLGSEDVEHEGGGDTDSEEDIQANSKKPEGKFLG